MGHGKHNVKKESPNMGTKTIVIRYPINIKMIVKKESPNMGTKGRLVWL